MTRAKKTAAKAVSRMRRQSWLVLIIGILTATIERLRSQPDPGRIREEAIEYGN
jgi:hypothetical protein